MQRLLRDGDEVICLDNFFSGKRAIGVAYLQGGSSQPTTVHARREVLLCAGAIASPQILQRSGVGPAPLLRGLDIAVVRDLPGVGANLQDHLEMYLQYACKEPVSLYPALKAWNQPAIGAEWLFKGTGIGASNQFEAGGFIRSRAGVRYPDIQHHFLPMAVASDGSAPPAAPGLPAHVGPSRAQSCSGRVDWMRAK